MVFGEFKWRSKKKGSEPAFQPEAPEAKEEILPDSAVGPGVLAPEEIEKEATAVEGEDLSLAEIQAQSQKLQQEANDLFSALQKKYGRSKWDKNDVLYQQWRLATAQVRQWEELREMKESYQDEEQAFVKLYSKEPVSGDESYLEARESVKDRWLEELKNKKEMNTE